MRELRDGEPSWGAPPAQGLYDPQHEHDACGVGFVVDLKGRKSSDIVQKGIQVLLNLKHRGACGCETNTGDGAGHPDPDAARVLRRRSATSSRSSCPQPGRYGVGAVFLPADRASREACERLFEQAVREEGQELLGWRTVPTDNRSLGPTARASQPIIRQIFIGQRGPGLDAAEQMPALDDLNFERKLYVIRRKVRHAVRKAGIPSAHFYIPSLSSRTIVYKGMLNPEQLREFYPDLAERPRGVGAGDGALALLDQHLPQLVARASLPADRAQRRDQHAARQRQLDARAREHVRVEAVRRRPQEADPGHRHRRQRLGAVRQRARAAGAGGPVAAARDHDDDPRAVVEPRVDVGREEGVLRVPRLPDGAVGRPGVDGVHRRRAHRRGARPQRPAPVALLRHQGRPGHHGVRGRRARHSAPSACWKRGGCSRAHVPGRHGAGPHHRRRRDQASDRRGRAVRRVAEGQPGLAGRAARRRPRATRPTTRRCCGASRRSATRPRTSRC